MLDTSSRIHQSSLHPINETAFQASLTFDKASSRSASEASSRSTISTSKTDGGFLETLKNFLYSCWDWFTWIICLCPAPQKITLQMIVSNPEKAAAIFAKHSHSCISGLLDEYIDNPQAATSLIESKPMAFFTYAKKVTELMPQEQINELIYGRKNAMPIAFKALFSGDPESKKALEGCPEAKEIHDKLMAAGPTQTARFFSASQKIIQKTLEELKKAKIPPATASFDPKEAAEVKKFLTHLLTSISEFLQNCQNDPVTFYACIRELAQKTEQNGNKPLSVPETLEIFQDLITESTSLQFLADERVWKNNLASIKKFATQPEKFPSLNLNFDSHKDLFNFALNTFLTEFAAGCMKELREIIKDHHPVNAIFYEKMEILFSQPEKFLHTAKLFYKFHTSRSLIS